MRRPNFQYEKELATAGYRAIAGVDEAGTGALAGPVVAAAVILPSNSRLGLLRDSKLLSARQREKVFSLLHSRGAAFATGIVTIEEVNKMNIRAAALLAMRRAVNALALPPDALLVDAFKIPNLILPQRAVVHGDRLVKSIAAASVVAKVTRDALMLELARQYPGYGFARHKGYGTAAHCRALRRLGATPAHRLNFAPVKECPRG
ncbi:ribonuclease HII [Patescibacteria group bacterium]|nr:MAG: ribonuclease HII [Patescibacteria group bacterium]